MLSVLRLYSGDDRIINEMTQLVRREYTGENEVLGKNQPPVPL
jgi:hypothetical protein